MQFEWIGDPEDDCFCRWNGMFSHAECMYQADPDNPEEGDDRWPEYWHCSVYRVEVRDGKEVMGEQLFHDSEDDIRPLTGPAARKLCELVMELEWYKTAAQAALDACDKMGQRLEAACQPTTRQSEPIDFDPDDYPLC